MVGLMLGWVRRLGQALVLGEEIVLKPRVAIETPPARELRFSVGEHINVS